MAYNPYQPPRVQTTILGVVAPSFTSPWLLYAYPWAPYSRRVIIYLREKGIPESQIKTIQVGANGAGENGMPPPPEGSLPILAVPTKEKSFLYIRQPNAIIFFLEELCNDFQYGFGMPHGYLLGKDPLARARIAEVMSLAEECTIAWNSVGMSGTDSGTMPLPGAAKEMIRCVRRALMTIERFSKDRDMSLLQNGLFGQISIADIVLYQFIEFVHECYDVDMTIGSAEMVEDVYGREVKEEFPKLVEFYQAFKTRDSAIRDPSRGEVTPDEYKNSMSTWADGVFSFAR